MDASEEDARVGQTGGYNVQTGGQRPGFNAVPNLSKRRASSQDQPSGRLSVNAQAPTSSPSHADAVSDMHSATGQSYAPSQAPSTAPRKSALKRSVEASEAALSRGVRTGRDSLAEGKAAVAGCCQGTVCDCGSCGCKDGACRCGNCVCCENGCSAHAVVDVDGNIVAPDLTHHKDPNVYYAPGCSPVVIHDEPGMKDLKYSVQSKDPYVHTQYGLRKLSTLKMKNCCTGVAADLQPPLADHVPVPLNPVTGQPDLEEIGHIQAEYMKRLNPSAADFIKRQQEQQQARTRQLSLEQQKANEEPVRKHKRKR